MPSLSLSFRAQSKYAALFPPWPPFTGRLRRTCGSATAISLLPGTTGRRADGDGDVLSLHSPCHVGNAANLFAFKILYFLFYFYASHLKLEDHANIKFLAKN